MPDRNTENQDSHDLEPYEANAPEEREFTERLLRINGLVDGMRAKALAFKCNRGEYDSISAILPKLAVLSERQTPDLSIPGEFMPRLRIARNLIDEEIAESTKNHFKDVLEKMEIFRRKIVAENGVEYLTDFDDRPNSVRYDLMDIFKTMGDGTQICRRIGHNLSAVHDDKSQVLLRDYNPESEKLAIFDYALSVMRQLDNDILDSLKFGDDIRNTSKLILQRSAGQCSLMYNETAGKCIAALRIDEKIDLLGNTGVEKMQAVADMVMRTLFCLSKTKEALRWLEK